MKSCCMACAQNKKCARSSNKKVFALPRKFSKKQCKKSQKGFTMRASCAPYKNCTRNKK